MRGHRRRQTAAIDASLLLVQDAIVQIRAMAYRRANLGDAVEPGDDYHERIRMIADACETCRAIYERHRRVRLWKAFNMPGTRPMTTSESGCKPRCVVTASTSAL